MMAEGKTEKPRVGIESRNAIRARAGCPLKSRRDALFIFGEPMKNMNVNGICTAENIEEQKQCLHYRRSCVYKHELCADLKFNTKRCDSRKANKE